MFKKKKNVVLSKVSVRGSYLEPPFRPDLAQITTGKDYHNGPPTSLLQLTLVLQSKRYLNTFPNPIRCCIGDWACHVARSFGLCVPFIVCVCVCVCVWERESVCCFCSNQYFFYCNFRCDWFLLMFFTAFCCCFLVLLFYSVCCLMFSAVTAAATALFCCHFCFCFLIYFYFTFALLLFLFCFCFGFTLLLHLSCWSCCTFELLKLLCKQAFELLKLLLCIWVIEAVVHSSCWSCCASKHLSCWTYIFICILTHSYNSTANTSDHD